LGFTWKAEGFGYFTATSEFTEFNFNYGSVKFTGKLANPVPWGANGEGPAGWTDALPLPLHWFVHSLGSKIVELNFSNSKTGDNL